MLRSSHWTFSVDLSLHTCKASPIDAAARRRGRRDSGRKQPRRLDHLRGASLSRLALVNPPFASVHHQPPLRSIDSIQHNRTHMQPCGEPGACPFVSLGGSVLLAPPSAVAALQHASYGDAVLITPTSHQHDQQPTAQPTVIARLRPLLGGNCACQRLQPRSSSRARCLVLPRNLFVTLPSEEDDGVPVSPLPIRFQAHVEPLFKG